MSAAAADRINATEIVPGSVIMVELSPAGDLVTTRRKRDALTVRVTGKDLVNVPGERNRKYVIHTTGGTVRPAAGCQTFTVGKAENVTEAPAVDQAERNHAGDRPASDYPVTDARSVDCEDHDGHQADTLGCAPYVMKCKGVPARAEEIARKPITTGERATGADLVGNSIASALRFRHTVADVEIGYSDPYARGNVRQVSTWSMLVDGHRVTVVGYEGRNTLSAWRSLAAILVDGEMIAAGIDAARPPVALAGDVAYRVRTALEALATGDDSPAARLVKGDPLTFTAKGEQRTGTVVRVKRDGLITVDVPDSDGGTWWDVHPSQIVTEAPAPAVDQAEAPAGRTVHTFGDTGEAYNATQCRDEIADGDVIHVPSERVTGLLMKAWPVAVTAERGELHGGDLDAMRADGYGDSIDQARALAESLGYALSTIDGDQAEAPAPAGDPMAPARATFAAGFAAVCGDDVRAEAPAVTRVEVGGVCVAVTSHSDASDPAPAVDQADDEDDEQAPAPTDTVPTRDGVPAGLPYVVRMPAGWTGDVVRLVPTDIGKILRGTKSAPGILAHWFPGVKFSVRSGWDGVDISWTDGPAGDLVDVVTDWFQGQDFDGMDDSTRHRGPVLLVDGAGNATAYSLPGVYVSVHRDVTEQASAPALALLDGLPESLNYGQYSDPFGRPWHGGPHAECARWMARNGVDEWTRTRGIDKRPACPVERCELVQGHPWPAFHRTEHGRVFLATLPGDGGNGGGEPAGDPVDPQPAGESFGTWEQLAEHIRAGAEPFPAVDQATEQAPATVPAPAGRAFTVTNDARGNLRVHRPGCRDIKRDTDGGGTHWDVTTVDVAGIVCDLYGDATPETWQDFAGDIDVMPCAGDLPDVVPAPAVTWTGGPRTWFTCTGCKRAKLDPSGGSAQSSDGQTLCRDCNGERIAQHWDGQPSGLYGVAVNGEPAGTVRHVQAEPHAFTEDGADRTHCGTPHGAGKCGRLASSPIHQGGNGGGEPAVDPAPAGDQADDSDPADVPATGYDAGSPAVQAWQLLGAVTSTNTEARTRMFRAMRRVHGLAELVDRAEIMQEAEALKSARDLDSRSWPGKCSAYLRTYGALLTEDGAGKTHAAEPEPAPAWLHGKPKAGQLVAVPALHRTDGQRAEGVHLVAERVTALGCGCYRIESDRPGPYTEGGRQWVAVLTGCTFHERTASTPEPTADELDQARAAGRQSQRDRIPVDAPGEHEDVTALAKRYPVGDGARLIRDAYREGYALAAEKFAADGVALVEHARTLAATTAEIAERNPAAQPMADQHAAGVDMCEREHAARIETAEQARAVAPKITVRPWVTAHLTEDERASLAAPVEPAAEAPAPAGEGDDQAATVPAVGVAATHPAPNGRMKKRPAVGEYVHTDAHGVCEVVAVHGRGGEDIGARNAAGERLSLTRHHRAHWLVVDAPAGDVDQADDEDDQQSDDDPRSIYRLPVEAYAPELESDEDAEITLRHDHEDGTVIEGSSRGDGVFEIARGHGMECRRGVIFKRHTRDRFADLPALAKLAAALREAGHTVAVEIDDVWRPASDREDARAVRVSERAARLAERATRKYGEAHARRMASRSIADGMPFGEPIKRGHHSERAHRRAFERMESNDRASYAARDYAEELARRADAAERNEDAKQGPRAIMRRVETLKTDRRAWLRRLADTDKGTTGYARTCRLHIERISEDIAFQVAKLGDLAASGAFVAWSAESVQRGDWVNVGGDWREVARVNRKGVSVRALYQWDTRDTIRPVTWDQIHGRRRGDMQTDAPNATPWPTALAKRVARWESLKRSQGVTYDRSDTAAVMQRAHTAQALRLVLGIRKDASAQEVAAFGEPADESGKRARALACMEMFERLEAGEKFDQIAATVTPIGDTEPAWRMPEGDPVEVFGRELVPGDIVAGVWDDLFGVRSLSTAFVGPVTAVPKHLDRRESGDWEVIEIAGEVHEVRSFRRFAVHQVGKR